MPRSPDDLLFVGTYGHVRAIDKKRGRMVWDTSLPKTGYDVVTLLHEDGLLFAASKGQLFALDPETGRIRWRNALKNMGHGHLLLATTRVASHALLPLVRSAEDAAAAATSSGAGTR